MIYIIRGQKVMIDSDLAELYKVDTGQLNRAVKRNSLRFPEDFMFQLTNNEFKEVLKSEIEVFEQNAVFIGEKREKINNPESIGLHDYKKIAKIENALKKKFK